MKEGSAGERSRGHAGSTAVVTLAGLRSTHWLGTVLSDHLPSWRADPHVICFCQSAVLSAGGMASVIPLRRLLRHRRSAWLMACTWMVAIAISGRWLLGL